MTGPENNNELIDNRDRMKRLSRALFRYFIKNPYPDERYDARGLFYSGQSLESYG